MVQLNTLVTGIPVRVEQAMASPSEKLAESLAALKKLQDHAITAIRSDQLTRTHRERLLKNGFILLYFSTKAIVYHCC